MNLKVNTLSKKKIERGKYSLPTKRHNKKASVYAGFLHGTYVAGGSLPSSLKKD